MLTLGNRKRHRPPEVINPPGAGAEAAGAAVASARGLPGVAEVAGSIDGAGGVELVAAAADHGDRRGVLGAHRGPVGGRPGVVDRAEVSQRQRPLGGGRRLGDDFRGGVVEAAGLVLGLGPALGVVGQGQRVVGAADGDRGAHAVPGRDRIGEVHRVGRVHLVPAVVVRRAAAAVGVGPGLLDRVTVVPVQADPEGGVLGAAAATGAGLAPVGGDAVERAAAAGDDVAGPVGAGGAVLDRTGPVGGGAVSPEQATRLEAADRTTGAGVRYAWMSGGGGGASGARATDGGAQRTENQVGGGQRDAPAGSGSRSCNVPAGGHTNSLLSR